MAKQTILTVPEAASLLRISRNGCYDAIKRGEIPAIRIGRRLLVPRAKIERMLADAGATPSEPAAA